MPGDLSLSREEIEQIVRKYRDGGQISSTDAVRLFQHVLSEPDRIEAAARIAALEAEIAALKAQVAVEGSDAAVARRLVRDLNAENAALRERNKKLVEGLQPFADADVDERCPDHNSIWEQSCAVDITAGDLRRARALLQGQGGSDAETV